MSTNIRTILWEAWTAAIGVEVAVSDVPAFKRRFYAERASAREEGITEFDILQLISPPPDVIGKMWIVKELKNEQVGRKEQGQTGEEVD